MKRAVLTVSLGTLAQATTDITSMHRLVILGRTLRVMRSLPWLGVVVLIISVAGCGGQDRYIPATIRSDPAIEALVVELEEAVNAGDEISVCALYLYPSPRCRVVWRKRFASLTRPVNLVFRGTTPDCAGADRVTLAPGSGIGSVSVVVEEGLRGIIDVGIGNRRSSAVLPRYGNCANGGGSASTPRCDPADAYSFSEIDPCPQPRRTY